MNLNYSRKFLTSIISIIVLLTGCSSGGSSNSNTNTATLQNIAIAPANDGMFLGEHTPYFALGDFSDGKTLDITDQVTWTSSNPNIAMINSNGVANPVSIGATKISASLNGIVSGEATLGVVAESTSDIFAVITLPFNNNIPVGSHTQSSLTLLYSINGVTFSRHFPVSSATWTSEDPTIASIDSNGVVTGISSGQTTIRAVFGTESGNYLLTVE